MRNVFILLLLTLFIGSCDWKPEPLEVFSHESFRKVDIVVGITTIIEIEGDDFTIDSFADSSIVEIISNDSGYFEISGIIPGQAQLSYNYFRSSEEDDGTKFPARILLILDVTNGFPLRVNVEDSVQVDLSTYMDSIQVVDHDSVDIRFSSGAASEHNTYHYDMDSTNLDIHGNSPGREGLIVTLFQQSDTLGEPLFFDITTTIHKVVFAELFTNSGCVNCPEANGYLDNISDEFAEDFVIVRYHVNWTDPFDPMNLYNPGDVENRRAFYNIFAAPGFVLEGTLIASLDEEDWMGRVSNASLATPTIYISEVDVLESVDSLHLEFELNPFGTPQTDVTVWSMVVEDSIDYAGSNGEDLHMGVMRDMAFTAFGSIDELQTIRHSLKKPDDYGVVGPMGLILFIQSQSNKSILQARKQVLY
ncbi:MAG: hypothetical protein HQ506_12815 [Candidatus Marinimicrobia bacterium]|nr:hypothetical protein [Candidatus Neomarinimicrobiota bacterium]